MKNSKHAVRQNTTGHLGWRCRAGTHWDVCLHCEESITPDSVSGPSHCFFTKGGEAEPYSVDRYTSLLYFGSRFDLTNDAEPKALTNTCKSNTPATCDSTNTASLLNLYPISLQKYHCCTLRSRSLEKRWYCRSPSFQFFDQETVINLYPTTNILFLRRREWPSSNSYKWENPGTPSWSQSWKRFSCLNM